VNQREMFGRLEAVCGDLHTLGAAMPEGEVRAEIFRIRRDLFEYQRDLYRALEDAKEAQARSVQVVEDSSADPEWSARQIRCLDYRLDERLEELKEYITFYNKCATSGDFLKGEESEFYKRYGICGGFGDGQRKTTET